MKQKNIKIDKKRFSVSKVVIVLMLLVIIASYVVQVISGI